MNAVYVIIFPFACCIPFALFFAYQKMVIRNKVKNAAFLFLGMVLGGLTVFGMQLPVLFNNPSFNRMMNQFLEALGSDSAQQLLSQNTTPTPNINNNDDDDDDEEETDDDDDNTNANTNRNTNRTNTNQQNNRRVYETTFTIPIDQNNLFNEIFNNQFSSLLNQARQRRTATNTRRTRFPTTPPNNNNNNSNNNAPITPVDNNDINNTD